MAMSLGNNNGVVAGINQDDVDSNIQRAISQLHPFLVNKVLSNPITSRKMRNHKPDFSQSLQAIINDWTLFYPTGSKFAYFHSYFRRAILARNFVAHQSFDSNRYQHFMESLAKVATAIGEPDLNQKILQSIAIKSGNNKTVDDWTSLKQEGNQHYQHKRWAEAMTFYTRAIHLNQEEATLYSNRALCELNLSKFDLAREDIEDAIQLDPKNVKYFRILSEVLLKMNFYEESLAACRKGLTIDPRDEILNVRERDCRALIVPVLMDVPVLGKSIKILGREYRLAVLPNPHNLHLTSEDIEDCDFDKYSECSNLSTSLEKARQFELAATPDGEREALKIYEDAANKGIAYGLYFTARFYNYGKAGLSRDFPRSMDLCRQTVTQKAFLRHQQKMMPNVGVAEAEAFLGNCYRDGRGVDKSSTDAFQWYLKAARHNCLTGQNSLGLALLNGDGCRIDEAAARSWFQKAAEFDLAEAQYNYAMMLEEGRGGPMDVKKAGEMLQLAVEQDHAGALERLQKLSRSGALGASAMEQTYENLCSKADKGDPVSQYLVGKNYLNGVGGFAKDLRQAERHLRVASNCGHADAHLPLGKLLLDQKRNEEAFKFLKLSAEQGSSEGQFQLGLLFNFGHGCARDEAKARRWLNRAKMQSVMVKSSHDGKIRDDDEWVEEMINFGRNLCEFETQNRLTSEGLSLEGRKRRFDKSKIDPNDRDASEHFEFLDIVFPPDGPPQTSKDRKRKVITPEIIYELQCRAENGSAIAQSFFNSHQILERAVDRLKKKRTNEAFKLFRLSMREWNLIQPEFLGFYEECYQAATKALDRNSQDADALYVLAKMGIYQSYEERLQMAKRCIELDPSVPDFHHLLADMCGFIQDHKNGLRAIERALELLPSQTGWMYERADLMSRLVGSEMYTIEAVNAYLKFVSSNPVDHPKVPEAYYFLAYIFVRKGELSLGKAYYQQGLEFEDFNIRLPCFDPVNDDSIAKRMTLMLLKGRESKIPLEETDCANCWRGNRTLLCRVCNTVRYCDQACRKAHLEIHKLDCKRVNPS